MALCLCGCGKETNIGKITKHPNRYCHGHNGPRIPDDRTGQVFGRWTLVSLADSGNSHHTRWLCRCVCGTEKVRILSNITGRSLNTGCGCVSRHGKRPFETIYNLLLNTAKGRTECLLTFDEFLTYTKEPECHYCGAALLWKPFYGSSNGYKLDRKDNSVGYTKDNCVVCCARCNRAKSDHFTYDEWLQIGALIRSWKK